jgi:hypothetical protein
MCGHGDHTIVRGRRASHTELIAFLATQPAGVAVLGVAQAVQLAPSQARTDVSRVRIWLHVRPCVTDARSSGGRYDIQGVPNDADLFAGLRQRGRVEGPGRGAAAGHREAVQPRRDGRRYRRLAAERPDQHLAATVAAVTHTLRRPYLDRGDVSRAEDAASTAAVAAPNQVSVRADLLAVRAAALALRSAATADRRAERDRRCLALSLQG